MTPIEKDEISLVFISQKGNYLAKKKMQFNALVFDSLSGKMTYCNARKIVSLPQRKALFFLTKEV